MGWETALALPPRSGQPIPGRARRSSMPWSAARPMQRPAAYDRQALRWIRLHRRRCQHSQPCRDWLYAGRAHGRHLGPAPAGKAPTFLVAALRDPIGANLDCYQIVKGWVDAKGEMQEKVYDVAWSGDRKPGVPPVGSTAASATWTIGAPELIAVWTDPDFDPAQRPPSITAACSKSRRRAGRRMTQNTLSNAKMGPKVTMQMQERAYTSPHLVHAAEVRP